MISLKIKIERIILNEIFLMPLSNIQPSQLYISKKKLKVIEEKIKKANGKIDPIPIKKLGNDIIYTDGHTRAFAAYKMGLEEIEIEWEDEDLDWEMYEICVVWCRSEQIFTIKDLENRVIPHKNYEILWYNRCDILHKEIQQRRKNQLKKV